MAKKKSVEEETAALTAPDTITLEANLKAASDDVSALREALAEAEEAHAAAKAELGAAIAPPLPPITGPRIKLEDTGEIVAVAAGDERQRRLLIAGRNYEHVADIEDQGEVIWVYRQM